MVVHVTDDGDRARVHLTIASDPPDAPVSPDAVLVVEKSLRVVSGAIELSGHPAVGIETLLVSIPPGDSRARLHFVSDAGWLQKPSTILPGAIDVIEPVWAILWPEPLSPPVIVVDRRPGRGT